MSTDRIWQLMARKLAGEASASELQELDNLLRANPELHLSIQTITDLWQHRNETKSDETLPKTAYEKHILRMQELGIGIGPHEEDQVANANPILLEGVRPLSWRRFLSWAAAAVLIFAVGWLVIALFSNKERPDQLAGKEKQPVSEISTRNGSRTTIQLPDGSQVWLNAGSKLSYDKKYGTGLREVTLTGEAYFDVVKNPDMPFIIHTNRMDIKVLGTQFNVKSYPGEKTTEAALVKGSIEVSIKDRPAEKIILKPNEKIIVSSDTLELQKTASKTANEKIQPDPIIAIRNLTYQDTDSAIVETGWVYNKLVFKDESFRELALKMERWYGISIRFTDEAVQKLHFTGTFETETIQQALSAMKLTSDFNFQIGNNNNIIISK